MKSKKKNLIFLLTLLFSFSITAGNLTFSVDSKILPKKGEANSAEKKFEIKKSFDGKTDTYYLSKKDVFPVTLKYSFSKVARIDYIQYLPPQLENNVGKITEIELWYTTENGERTKYDDFKLDVLSESSRIVFPTPLKNVVSIELLVKSAVENVVGCAEIEFYRSNTEKMQPSSGYASNYQRGEGIEKSFDNNIKTTYHSSWKNTEFPITLRYDFSDVDKIDYLVYNPRQDATNGLFKEVEIWYTTKTQERTKFGDFDFRGSNSSNQIDFSEPLINPVSVEFIVKSGVGDNGTGFASCAEMEFYKLHKGKTFDLNSIFANNLCSELKPGISKKEIDKIPVFSIRKLALNLLEKKHNTEFRIAEFKPYQFPEVMAKKNKTNTYSLRDNPTGISLKKNEDILVFVENLHGQSVSLLVQNLDDGFGGKSYALKEGINIFNSASDGLAYIMYMTETATENPIKMHIAGGSVNGYFDSQKHSAADWKRLIDNATDTYFDVLGKYAHLTFNTEDFRKYTPDGLELINVYDRIVELEQDFMGLYKYNREFNNRMYLHTVYGKAYMYASSYRTAYHKNTLKELCDVDKLKTIAVWGPAHEIGHCNQTRPGLKWSGTTEVTNNIHSQHVQTAFGNPSRLMSEKIRDYGNRYNKAQKTVVEAKIPHNAADDVFCKLVPFWQLKLYVHDVLGNEDFYKDIYEKVRVTPDPATEGECQLQFVKFSCETAQLDLTDFFTLWGFLTPVDKLINDYSKSQFVITQEQIDSLIAEIKAMNLPKPKHDNIHLINDDNVAEYK